MSQQKKILNEIAERHNIPIMIAEEIYYLLTKKIAETISDPDKKNSEGNYAINKFKIIHIDNFGKFKPNIRNIRHANSCLAANKKKKKNGNG